MSDIVVVPLMWIRGIATALAIAVVCIFFAGRCSVSTPDPLPAPTQRALDAHIAKSVADTVTVHRLERVALAAAAKSKEDSTARVRAERAARISADRADSLAARASLSTTASDSARAYQAAYVARTHEADSLSWVVDLGSKQLAAAGVRQAATDSIADVWKVHALRADSLVAQLVPLAEHRDQCKIAWVLNCPTRTQALVGGVIVGTVTTLVATRTIRIPLSVLGRARAARP